MKFDDLDVKMRVYEKYFKCSLLLDVKEEGGV